MKKNKRIERELGKKAKGFALAGTMVASVIGCGKGNIPTPTPEKKNHPPKIEAITFKDLKKESAEKNTVRFSYSPLKKDTPIKQGAEMGTIRATDPDGDRLRYTENSDCLAIGDNGKITAEKDFALKDLKGFTVGVSDGKDTAEESLEIKERKPNDAEKVELAVQAMDKKFNDFKDAVLPKGKGWNKAKAEELKEEIKKAELEGKEKDFYKAIEDLKVLADYDTEKLPPKKKEMYRYTTDYVRMGDWEKKGDFYYPSFIEFKDLSKGITVEQGKVGVTIKGKLFTVDDMLEFAKNNVDRIHSRLSGVTHSAMDGITAVLPRPTAKKSKQILRDKAGKNIKHLNKWLTRDQDYKVDYFFGAFTLQNAKIHGLSLPRYDTYRTLQTGITKFILLQSFPARYWAIASDENSNSPKSDELFIPDIKQMEARKSCILNLSLLELTKRIYALPKDKQWDILDWLSSIQHSPNNMFKRPFTLKEYQDGIDFSKKQYPSVIK